MKEGWKYRKLSEVCRFFSGFAFKSNKFTENGMPIIRISDIQNGEINDTNVVYFNPSDYVQDLTRYIIYPGEILIAMSGGTTGKIGKNKTNKEFYLNQRVGAFREDKSIIEHDYLFYYLLTKSKESLRIAAGAAQPNLSSSQINNYIIPVPSLAEQQRIVERLDAAFAQIDELKNNAERQLAEARALFQSALTQAMQPKLGWQEKKLKVVTTKIGSGATPKGGRSVYIDKGVSLVRSLNVHNAQFKYRDLAHITDEAANLLSGVELKPDDVLFNITGASIARCCVLPNEILPGRVNQHVSIIRSIKEIVLPQFLCYTLLSGYHQKELLAIGLSGATRQALTKKDLENHSVFIPNQDIQQKTVDYLDDLSSRISDLEVIYNKTAAECDALKQALLRQIFE